MVSADSPRQDMASTAVAPLAPAPHAYGPCGARLRPDPSFIMQLIATAAHAPQTRRLRQASARDGIARYLAARVAVGPRAPEGSRFKDSA
jgi:hypothetical protein